MKSSRLEAFSDGVLAIIITIMILELKVPESYQLASLLAVLPKLLAYLLSYAYVAIYWNNHHHLLSSITKTNAKVLWGNMMWLFFMSLIPFSTAWLSHFYKEQLPAMVYGIVFLLTAFAYIYLQKQVVNISDAKEELQEVIGKDKKGKISAIFYTISIILSFVSSYLSIACFIIVAIMWFVPDKRFSKVLNGN
ncbi:hypothetical protein A9Q68_03845 [Streptococcus bovimastitidis]|uniref:DUF1211 domain-containing membrane protein n=1 Tax=Streptococcus bovimastitidis TaxID=1856638 RepID=A0A1L8MPJ0_9STRE|nr:TMEM175 family protein [Streptococcus bovimastitidis]OJF72691.1 hypothetical protein A9Q68_03845 [Streptococcus bovimastitidis]